MSASTRGSDGATVTVLLTGAGAPGASGIVRSLRAPGERDVHVVGVDMDPDAYGFAFVDEHAVVPPGNDDAFVPAIAALVDEVEADVVLPLVTAELQPLAAGRHRIDATVMVSDADRLAIANDKGALYAALEDAGFAAAPAFRRVSDREAFVDAVHDLGYPETAVCFKPPVASGKRGFRVLDESDDGLSRLLERKPDGARTTLDAVLPVLDGGKSFPELVVMEYLPGEEYSVDVVATDGDVRAVVPRTRATTRAGISFEGTVVDDTELQHAAARITRTLGLEFNVNLQFRRDADGDPKVVEINPRVSGSIVCCVAAGANLPYMGVKHALGEPLREPEVAWGTEMRRHWDELFVSPNGDRYRYHPEGFGTVENAEKTIEIDVGAVENEEGTVGDEEGAVGCEDGSSIEEWSGR